MKERTREKDRKGDVETRRKRKENKEKYLLI